MVEDWQSMGKNSTGYAGHAKNMGQKEKQKRKCIVNQNLPGKL